MFLVLIVSAWSRYRANTVQMLGIFLVRAGCLLVCRHCFPRMVLAHEEIDLVKAFFFQVVEGARVVNGKEVEEVVHDEFSP